VCIKLFLYLDETVLSNHYKIRIYIENRLNAYSHRVLVQILSDNVDTIRIIKLDIPIRQFKQIHTPRLL